MSDKFIQIFLSNLDETLPEVLSRQASKFKELYSDCYYLYFDRTNLRDWMGDVMGPDILLAYDTLKPLAFKSDLARYCLIYHYGGWYADITLKPLIGMRLSSDIRFAYFYDSGSGLPCPMRSSHDVMNAFFYSRTGNPILSSTIESILKNIRERNYGATALCITGPTLFGRSIAQYSPCSSMLMGHFIPLTPSHPNQNRAFVAQDGSIVALHKSAWHSCHPGAGELSPFGIKGSNNYEQLWLHHDVF